MKRLSFLREQALDRNGGDHALFYYLFFTKYARLALLPEYERYAEAFYCAFSELPPTLSDGELIVGKCDHALTEAQQEEWNTVCRPITDVILYEVSGGQDSHMAIDYELLLSRGIDGVIEQIDCYATNVDDEKRAFYACCKRCLQAVVCHAERYADEALRLSESAAPDRKAELLEIAAICRKVPKKPAETFYEAVQAGNFISYCLTLNPLRYFAKQQFQLGHPDRYLLPYYERDVQNGTLTKERAQLLLDCLGIQINCRVPNGLSCGYMVGGRDKNGVLVQNDLTAMCMQVIDDIHLVYPSVGLCFTKGMDERYLDKACELLTKGYSHPAVFNDDVITAGLQYHGVPETQAHDYIHSTCVEITPVAASNVWVASPYTNMAQLLLDTMVEDAADFETLVQRLLEKLDDSIRVNFEEQNRLRAIREQRSMNPLLSCFVSNCLARGLDIERGGAVYNWIMPSFVGMANLVDALYALNTLVFEEKRLTLAEFKAILDNNFENEEAFRQYLLHKLPKYGNDIDAIDGLFERFTTHILKTCELYRGMFSNGQLIPSVFCWEMHERFGKQTGATPDGRTAGFPLGDGSGPCQGREANGPTASILSSTKWEHKKLIGGVAVNLKFSKASLGATSQNTIKALIKTYLSRGGFELQINVVDNETLKKAQIFPEQYRDLVVRIGGYSDYFVRLSPEMQQEVIVRTTHHV